MRINVAYIHLNVCGGVQIYIGVTYMYTYRRECRYLCMYVCEVE